LWLLGELEAEFEVTVYPFDDTIRQPSFLNLSPVGRVPALEIDGEEMFESGAMIEYLCERFADRNLGRPPGDLDRIDWLTWVHFAETISQHCAALTQQHIALREDVMRSPVIMKLEAARLAKCFGAIEARLSTPIENRDYLLTSGFSAADVACGQAVYMGRHFVRLDAYPEAAKWMARLATRPAFQAALPPDDAMLLYKQDFYPVWPDTPQDSA